LVKTYRVIQKWDSWLGSYLGQELIATEKQLLQEIIASKYAKFGLVVGVPSQSVLLDDLNVAKNIVLSQINGDKDDVEYVESNYSELPILSGSLECLVLPHILELLDNPRRLLSEACRVIKPEGKIVIYCFNKFSLWGIANQFRRKNYPYWPKHYISAGMVKEWLELEHFELVSHHYLMFRPKAKPGIFKKLKFLEWIGKKLHLPLGGVYAITAKAKVVPLTPIKLNWQQQLSALKVSFDGPTMRDMK